MRFWWETGFGSVSANAVENATAAEQAIDTVKTIERANIATSSEIQWVSVGHAKMFRPAEASYEKQACGLYGIVLMSTDRRTAGQKF